MPAPGAVISYMKAARNRWPGRLPSSRRPFARCDRDYGQRSSRSVSRALELDACDCREPWCICIGVSLSLRQLCLGC
jgi:hypothetical protein